jgi:antitoxin component YwqK of YwqJK toxin-antitoxin module
MAWHVNGQKEREETYKDGKLISDKMWDEDGMELFLHADGEWW